MMLSEMLTEGQSVTVEAQVILPYREYAKPTRSNTYNASPFSLIVDLDTFNSRPEDKAAYSKGQLLELAESMRDEGQLAPVTAVRRRADRGLLVVYGNRRTLAARLGIENGILPEDWTIRYEVLDGDESDAHRLFVKNLTENHERRDLTPLDQAANVARLKTHGLSHSEIATKMHRTKAWVSGMLKLPELPDQWRDMVSSGAMPVDVGINLARLGENAKAVMDFISREQLPVNMASFKQALRETKAETEDKPGRLAKMGRTIKEIRKFAESLGDAGAPLLTFIDGGDPEALRIRLTQE